MKLLSTRHGELWRPTFFVMLGLIGTASACSALVCTAQDNLRIATYNASLYGKVAGQIHDRLADGNDSQAEKVAAIVQTVRPDILLVNEIDFDTDGATAKLLATKFFAKPQRNLQPIDYPYVYAAPSNTGVASGLDLNNNGTTNDPNDAWGFGRYPGQYSMAVYSRFPIQMEQIRTFQTLRWAALPNALRPVDPTSGKSYYDDQTWNQLRLSSKNHIDVPVTVGDATIHILASHPTPPVFDGPEDRNGCRNHDEIRFWADYLDGPSSHHLTDDQQRRGGIAGDALLVIMGDLNSDPGDGDGRPEAIRSLLQHKRLQDPRPASVGGLAARRDGRGEPQFDTARFRHANMRIDYVLPSREMKLIQHGVFWPEPDSEESKLIAASDHRLVWIEVIHP